MRVGRMTGGKGTVATPPTQMEGRNGRQAHIRPSPPPHPTQARTLATVVFTLEPDTGESTLDQLTPTAPFSASFSKVPAGEQAPPHTQNHSGDAACLQPGAPVPRAHAELTKAPPPPPPAHTHAPPTHVHPKLNAMGARRQDTVCAPAVTPLPVSPYAGVDMTIHAIMPTTPPVRDLENRVAIMKQNCRCVASRGRATHEQSRALLPWRSGIAWARTSSEGAWARSATGSPSRRAPTQAPHTVANKHKRAKCGARASEETGPHTQR